MNALVEHIKARNEISRREMAENPIGVGVWRGHGHVVLVRDRLVHRRDPCEAGGVGWRNGDVVIACAFHEREALLVLRPFAAGTPLVPLEENGLVFPRLGFEAAMG